MNEHYCQEHQTKYYRNEKVRDGKTDIWYSHKKADGSGFCTEKAGAVPESAAPVPHASQQQIGTRPEVNGMLACNALNNAVALASAGKIEVADISSKYRDLLNVLTGN